VALLLLLGASLQCGRYTHRSYGARVDTAMAVPLSELDLRTPVDPKAVLVVSGRVREVCRTSGCWLVLEDASGGKAAELFVDLLPNAGFTVDPSIIGRTAVVSGYLAGEGPDLRVNALGLELLR